MDNEAIEDLTLGLLKAFGEDPDREGLGETPRRVSDAWKEMLSGMSVDPKEVLGTTFEESYDQIVALRDIEFYSVCEHHLLPFYGVAHVAYVPGLIPHDPYSESRVMKAIHGKLFNRRVVGISKLVRLVECFAKRLQIQERLTDEIGKTLVKHLSPQAAAVILEAKHLCMACRGVKQANTVMTTSFLSGAFRDKLEARAEVMTLLLRR